MGKKASGRTPRKMKPVILVLCEGETEECYVDCLKQKYRLPIRVVSKVVGQKINPRLVERYKKELQIRWSEQIDCFLIYDADVPEIAGKTAACNATAVLSRPCLEVWFLAHTEKVPATDFSSDECLRRLTKTKDWKEYRKGVLSENEKNLLWEKRLEASKNIDSSPSNDKAFSEAGLLIGVLENCRRENETGLKEKKCFSK